MNWIPHRYTLTPSHVGTLRGHVVRCDGNHVLVGVAAHAPGLLSADSCCQSDE